MSIKSDGRNEWIALAEAHFEKVKCEAKCIDIMEKHGVSIMGKSYIPDLEASAKAVSECIEMVVQYSDIKQ